MKHSKNHPAFDEDHELLTLNLRSRSITKDTTFFYSACEQIFNIPGKTTGNKEIAKWYSVDDVINIKMFLKERFMVASMRIMSIPVAVGSALLCFFLVYVVMSLLGAVYNVQYGKPGIWEQTGPILTLLLHYGLPLVLFLLYFLYRRVTLLKYLKASTARLLACVKALNKTIQSLPHQKTNQADNLKHLPPRKTDAYSFFYSLKANWLSDRSRNNYVLDTIIEALFRVRGVVGRLSEVGYDLRWECGAVTVYFRSLGDESEIGYHANDQGVKGAYLFLSILVLCLCWLAQFPLRGYLNIPEYHFDLELYLGWLVIIVISPILTTVFRRVNCNRLHSKSRQEAPILVETLDAVNQEIPELISKKGSLRKKAIQVPG